MLSPYTTTRANIPTQCRDLLETLVSRGYKSQTLLFNLATTYELCSNRAKDLKLKLAERLAAGEGGRLG